MANWNEIYTDDGHWCCKVPSNSIYYSHTERLSEIESTVRNMSSDSLFGCNKNRYSSTSYSYKNTKEVEELRLTFYPKYDRFGIDTFSGHVCFNMNYNKKEKAFYCKFDDSSSVANAKNYIKENFKWANETVIPANELLDKIPEFVKNILLEYQECFLKYYKEYQNNNNEFMLEYMDTITELTDKAKESGLNLSIKETGDKGYQLILMVDGNDNSKLIFYTEPCNLYSSRGSLDYMLKFCGIYSHAYLSGIPEMFKFIDNVIDCWNIASVHLDKYRVLFVESLASQDEEN